jgi:hypothetical protein
MSLSVSRISVFSKSGLKVAAWLPTPANLLSWELEQCLVC